MIEIRSFYRKNCDAITKVVVGYTKYPCYLIKHLYDMEATYSSYDYTKSLERISEIVAGSDSCYEDHKGIPSRDKLTFLNGYYVDVTVLFIDIRGSKSLSEKHTHPVMAKIYRAYISEVVAVLKNNTTVNEIYIEGDGVWAVFNTNFQSEVDSVFEAAAQLSSLVDIINIKLSKKGYSTIVVGIGMDYGKSLYIKAGYKGSCINEVVWIGKVVGSAANLSSNGNKIWTDKELMVSEVLYCNLKEEYKAFLEWNQYRQCYHGNVINIMMNDWVIKNA